MEIVFRPAGIYDAARLSVVLQEANQNKQAHDDGIWGKYSFTTDEAAEMIARGTTHVGVVAGTIAVMANLTWEDSRIWGPDIGTDGKAGYIHRLARADGYTGVGRRMLTYIEREIRNTGRPYARLDCPAIPAELGGYYLDNGYMLSGGGNLPNYSYSLYQKQL